MGMIDTPVKTKNEIFSIIKKNQTQIKKFGIKRLGIFGSFVRNDNKKNSDIDILVEFEENQKSFDNFMDTSYLLDDLFGKKVELVTAESLSPYIQPYIMKEIEYVTFTN